MRHADRHAPGRPLAGERAIDGAVAAALDADEHVAERQVGREIEATLDRRVTLAGDDREGILVQLGAAQP